MKNIKVDIIKMHHEYYVCVYDQETREARRSLVRKKTNILPTVDRFKKDILNLIEEREEV